MSNCYDVFCNVWTFFSVFSLRFEDADKKDHQLNAHERAYLNPASPHCQLFRKNEVGRFDNDDEVTEKSQLEELTGELLKIALDNHLKPKDACDAFYGE